MDLRQARLGNPTSGKSRFFQNRETPLKFGQLPGDHGADDSAADDDHIIIPNIRGGSSFSRGQFYTFPFFCLLYTSYAADDLLCLELCGRRIITQKHT